MYFTRPYHVIRFDSENGTIEIRRYNEENGHWHISGHWEHYSRHGKAYHNTAVLRYDQNHPKIRNQHEDDNEQDEFFANEQIQTLAHYASGQGYCCPKAEVAQLILDAVNELDQAARLAAAITASRERIENEINNSVR